MKKRTFLAVAIWMILSTCSYAGVTITTISGKVYENAEIKDVQKNSVTLSHGGGVTDVPLLELSKPVRKSLNLKLTAAIAKGDFLGQINGQKKILTDFDSTYKVHLNNLAKESQTKGRLEEVLAIKKELEVFQAGAMAEATNFEKLKQLRVIYDRERMKRRNKIIDSVEVSLKQFQIDLQELQKELTIANKLDEAIAVKKEEQKIIAMLADTGGALILLGIESGDRRQSNIIDHSAPGGKPVSFSATKNKPFENSLGMRFVPVPITGGPSDGKLIYFSIWETRIRDYEVFLKKTRRGDLPSLNYPVDQNHPVSLVTWDDAVAFCEWLTKTERKKGTIGSSDVYRIPKDHEWSCAVGIGAKEDASESPSIKSGKIKGIFPWGDEFPPDEGAGNYYGQETLKNPFKIKLPPIEGYEDPFDRSSPVGSFEPNEFGLYDLGGNAWEWCDDWYDSAKKEWHLIRGACWAPGQEFGLLSSYRHAPKMAKAEYTGFRIVIEVNTGR